MVEKENGKLSLNEKGEKEYMPIIVACERCVEKGQVNQAEIRMNQMGSVSTGKGLELRATLVCMQDGHEWPITIREDRVISTDVALPVTESSRLSPKVATDIADDIREAERAYFSQCYKAAVTMCRRAIQLGLIDKGIQDKPLSQMIEEAKKPGVLKEEDKTTAIAFINAVKVYGDIGAHRRQQIQPNEVPVVILTAVRFLNALFSPEST